MLNRWQRTIVDLRGNVVPYAQLQIRVESTQATATIYADKDGREPIPNGIVTADANGYAYFYAEADLYRISSMKPTIDWRHVDIGSANAVRVATEALNENLVTYPTLAALQADKSRDENSMGRVVNDGKNNGYYLWNGTTWVRTSYQPMQRDEFDEFVLHVNEFEERAEQNFLRKDIEQSAPLLRDIPQIGVVGLPYDVDQLYAQIWAARYPGLPAPSAYFEFGAGASVLSPDFTFRRASSAWGWRNGVLVEYGVNEPVFEYGGLRLEPQTTNHVRWSGDFSGWVTKLVNVEQHTDPIVGKCAKVTFDSLPGTKGMWVGGVRPGKIPVGRRIYAKSLDFAGYVSLRSGSTAVGNLMDVDQPVVSSGLRLTDGGTTPTYSADKREIGGGWWEISTSMTATSSDIQYNRGIGIVFGAEDMSSTSESVHTGSLLVACAMAVQGTEDASNLSWVETHDQPATRAADQFQLTGEAFDRAYNPAQGAFIFKTGEYSRLPNVGDVTPYYGAALWSETGNVTSASAGGVYFYSTDSGQFNGIGVKAPRGNGDNNAITHNIYPGDTIGLSWQGETISLFVNGGLAGSFTHPDVVGALKAVERFHIPDAQHMYLERISMFATRPTDAEMEALTYA